jgi:hypothetical protein
MSAICCSVWVCCHQCHRSEQARDRDAAIKVFSIHDSECHCCQSSKYCRILNGKSCFELGTVILTSTYFQMPPKYPKTGRPALPMNSLLRRSMQSKTDSTAPAPAKPKKGGKAKAAAPAGPSPPPPVATLPRSSKHRVTAKKPPTPESESESDELPLTSSCPYPKGRRLISAVPGLLAPPRRVLHRTRSMMPAMEMTA